MLASDTSRTSKLSINQRKAPLLRTVAGHAIRLRNRGTFVSQVRLTREMSAEMISTRSEIVVYDDDILSRDDLPRSIV